MAKDKPIILSEREHPLYTNNIDEWKFFRDAVKGGKEFLTESNLFSHRLEDTDDFSERLDRVYYLNYCSELEEVYNSYIFRENIKRPPDLKLDRFRKNADNQGTTIADFIKRAGKFAMTYGACHIFVDIMQSNKKTPTIADIKSEKISPFCSTILPTQLKDWSVDSSGNFNWIVFSYTHYEDLDPKKERVEQEHFKCITTKDWWIEDKDGNKVTFEDGTQSSGTNTLGFIPIYTLYHCGDNDDKIGTSMLKDIAYINRIVMNWCSLIDEQIERNTFSQLIMPDDAEEDEDEQRSADPLRRISTSSIFTFNPESKHPPAFISPETSTITTIWKLVVDHIREMFRLAGLQGGTSDLYTSRSGRQSQMSFKSVNSSLAEKSLAYQRCENAISRLAYAQLGLDIDGFEDVKYPTSFDVVGLAEEIDSMLKIMERNFSTILNKTLMKDVARKSTPLAPEKIRKAIEDEIDSDDGYVAPLSSTLYQPEKLGQGNTNSDLENAAFKSQDQVQKEQSSKRKEK